MTKKQTFTHSKTQLGGKPHFTLLTTGAIILALSFLATAGSCGNVGGGGDNGGGNGSGDGNGGDNTPKSTPGLKITPTDANSVKIVGDEIRIKNEVISRLRQTSTRNTDIPTTTDIALAFIAETPVKKIFEVTFTNADGTEATGGLVLAGNGNLAAAADFSTLESFANIQGGEEANRSITMVYPRANRLNGVIDSGTTFLSVFADRATAPTATTVDPNIAPFAFTEIATYKPILFCVTRIPGITSDNDADIVNYTLAGGEKADCYITYLEPTIGGVNDQNKWMATDASATFKKAFNVAFAGIKTDDKTLPNIGLEGVTPEVKAQKFITGGLSAAEMEAIVNAGNLAKYKKMTIKIVNNGDFLADGTIPPPPEFAIKTLNEDLAKVVTAESGAVTIKLKASAFPADVIKDNFESKPVNNVLKIWSTNIIPAFDVTMTGATGGLTLAAKGNLSKVAEFTMDGLCGATSASASTNCPTVAPVSGDMNRAEVETDRRKGLYVFSTFVANDSYTFSGTAGENATRPVIICNAFVPSIINDSGNSVKGAVKENSTFVGGQTARCYIGSMGGDNAGLGTVAARTKWLQAAEAGGNFRDSFDIAFAGIKTDSRPFTDMGWLGAAGEAMRADFGDGIDADTMTALIANNPTTYKKVTVEVVENFPTE